MTVQQIPQAAFAEEWQQWHAEHERKLADPHGFLAVTSLNWLNAEPARFDDAPGTWSSTGAGVTVQLAEGEQLTIGGAAGCGSSSLGAFRRPATPLPPLAPPLGPGGDTRAPPPLPRPPPHPPPLSH